METLRTFIKNCLSKYAEKIYRSGIGIVAIGIIARHLSLDEFGQYAYIVAIVTISEVMCTMGVPVILTREIAQDKGRAPILIACGLVMQSIFSIATLTIMGIVFYFLSPSNELFYAALTCAVAMIFKFYCRFFLSIYHAFERMGFCTLQAVLTQSLYLVFLMMAISKDLGLQGIFTALLLAHFAGSIFGYALVAKLFARPDFGNTKGSYMFLLKDAYPLAIKGLLKNLNFRTSTLLLAAMKTNVEVGIFNGPHKIMLHLMFIGEASSQAMFPMLSRFTVTAKSSLNVAYEKSLRFGLLAGLPLAIFLSRFAEPLIVLVLGQKYIESAAVLRVLGWALAAIFLTSFTEKMLVAGKKQHLTTIVMAVALGLNVLLNAVLIPRSGYVGAAAATLVSEMVVLCLSFAFVTRCLGQLVSPSAVVKPLIAGFATYAILFILGDINLFVGGLMEVIIYVGILIAIRTFTEEEIYYLKQLLRGTSSAEHLGTW